MTLRSRLARLERMKVLVSPECLECGRLRPERHSGGLVQFPFGHEYRAVAPDGCEVRIYVTIHQPYGPIGLDADELAEWERLEAAMRESVGGRCESCGRYSRPGASREAQTRLRDLRDKVGAASEARKAQERERDALIDFVGAMGGGTPIALPTPFGLTTAPEPEVARA
jgi:hypothetical protein